MQAPYLISMLADLQSGDSALAGRLKAVAMQLLPPLLGTMRARMLSGEVYWGPDAINLHRRLFFGMLVRNGTSSAGTSMSEPCLFSPRKLTCITDVWYVHAARLLMLITVALAFHTAVNHVSLLHLGAPLHVSSVPSWCTSCVQTCGNPLTCVALQGVFQRRHGKCIAGRAHVLPACKQRPGQHRGGLRHC